MPRTIDLAQIPGIQVCRVLNELHISSAVGGTRAYPFAEVPGKNIKADVITMLNEMKSVIDGIIEKVEGHHAPQS